MIISFEIELNIANKTLPIIWDNPNSPVKKPLYHRTLLQLTDYTDEITGIIVPGIISDQIEYEVNQILDHIRLINNEEINKLPIGIIDCNDDAIERLYDHADYCISYSQDKELDFSLDLLENKEWYKLISIIGNEKPYSEHHGLSNEWGQYRLLSQLNTDGNYDNELMKIIDNISESRFFKKLLLQEKMSTPTSNLEVPDSYNTILRNIRNKEINIAVIDDKVFDGWDKAYNALFPNGSIDYFDEVNENFDINKSSKYDLIILDLRLKEEVVHDSTEIFNIENLSGIQLLKMIKNEDPSVPVIMCTASNKSWSYDAAMNAGADGFWTKESPDFGMSIDYRFNNTLDLLNTIANVLKWSTDIRPLYKAMKKIYKSVNDIDPSIGKSISEKTKIIFSQLHHQKSKLIEDSQGRSGIVTAYLAICSLLNDTICFFRKNIDDKVVIIIEDDEYEFCYVTENEMGFQFELTENVIDTIINDRYSPIKESYFFPEKPFIYFLLEKLDLGSLRSKYGILSKIRNHLDLIHSKPRPEKFDQVIGNQRENDLPYLKLKQLYDMLEIFHLIFTNESLYNNN